MKFLLVPAAREKRQRLVHGSIVPLLFCSGKAANKAVPQRLE